jgi:hypothetical protein
MDSQLPSLHLHIALSQPILEKATLPQYFNDKRMVVRMDGQMDGQTIYSNILG